MLGLTGEEEGQFFPHHSVDKSEEVGTRSNPFLEALMAKTLAFFFVLGLMVSCASYHNERSISSVDKHDIESGYNYSMEPQGAGRY